MGTTTKMAIPYPEATGLVKDGWEDMKDIATQVDAKSGLVLLNTTTFSGVSSQSVNNVFSSNYDNYRILITVDDYVNDTLLYMRLRTTTDNTGTNYSYQVSGQAGDNQHSSITTTFFALSYYNTVTVAMISLDMFNPNRVAQTGLNAFYTINNGLSIVSGVETTTTQYTGFTIYPASGNFDGRLSVFGYNKG